MPRGCILINRFYEFFFQCVFYDSRCLYFIRFCKPKNISDVIILVSLPELLLLFTYALADFYAVFLTCGRDFFDFFEKLNFVFLKKKDDC